MHSSTSAWLDWRAAFMLRAEIAALLRPLLRPSLPALLRAYRAMESPRDKRESPPARRTDVASRRRTSPRCKEIRTGIGD